jgi:hypothetical protein
VDFSLWSGWHVTLFHPWAWFATGAVILIVLAVGVKAILVR